MRTLGSNKQNTRSQQPFLAPRVRSDLTSEGCYLLLPRCLAFISRLVGASFLAVRGKQGNQAARKRV